MTPAREPAQKLLTVLVDLVPVKGDAHAHYPPGHPYRLAVEALPYSVTRDSHLAYLQILVPLARIRGGL
jgi:hypothetical protein